MPDATTPLPPDTFRTVVASAPLVSIDLLVRDPQGRYLVGRRRNPPAQGSWFVPGGRIRKNEGIAMALQRLRREELGTALALGEPAFTGVHEHFYETNFAGDAGSATHYVVLAYTVALQGAVSRLPSSQHGGYRWMAPAELLADPDVHENTKAYFTR